MSSWTDFFGKDLEFKQGWDVSGVGTYPVTPDVGDFYVATSSGTLMDFTFSPAIEHTFEELDMFFYGGPVLGWQFVSGTNSTGVGGGLGSPLNVVYFDGVLVSSPYAASGNDAVVADTASLELTVTLPASPEFGDIIALMPATPTFTINKLTIDNNGNPIGGITDTFEIFTNDAVDLVWVDGTVGWTVVGRGQNAIYTDESGVAFYIVLEDTGIGHNHRVMVTDGDAQNLISGVYSSLDVLSTTDTGHDHLVTVEYVNGYFVATNIATNHIGTEHIARVVGWDHQVDWILYDGFTITSPALSASFEHWLVDTTSLPLTLLLPASPVDNARVVIAPAAPTYDINNLTVDPNGGLINGAAGAITVSTVGLAMEFVYQSTAGSWFLIEKGSTFISTNVLKGETWADVSTTTNILQGYSYFADSSGGAIVLTLPASPTNGNPIVVTDATDSATSFNITIGRNGKTIMGAAADHVISTNGDSVKLAYSATHDDWRIV